MKKKEITIPTLVGLLVTVAGLVTGLWLVKSKTGDKAMASEDLVPREVRVSNVSDSAFVVSWTTNKAETGFIQYAENSSVSEMVAADDRDQQSATIGTYFTHYVTVGGLKAETTYKFKIGSGKNLYDLSGQPYQAVTAPILASVPAADVAYGQVNTKNGDPAEGAVVYVQLPKTGLLSALVKSSGSWVIPLSTARTTDLKGYANYDLKTEKVDIQIDGGPLGNSALVTDTGNDSPVPNLILGEKYVAAPTAAEDLAIMAPQQGEKVNSTRPEIIGKAPSGASVSIEVHSSQVITGTAVADSNGNFSYSVPTDLAPGEHAITIKSIINGVTKSVSKSFTVYAIGESNVPAFSATPSGQMTPSPSTTPTKVPTPRVTSPTPTPRPTIFPTAIPTQAILPTPTPVTQLQQSGDTGMTVVVLVIAGMFIIGGGWWYRKAA